MDWLSPLACSGITINVSEWDYISTSPYSKNEAETKNNQYLKSGSSCSCSNDTAENYIVPIRIVVSSTQVNTLKKRALGTWTTQGVEH